MPKVSDEYRSARRREIADAAVRQILQHGVHGTTLAHITEESGLSAGAIYTHFESKDDIIAYVASSAIETVLSDLDSVVDTSPLPPPIVLLERITGSIPKTTDARLIVQLWGEAVTNASVRSIANGVFDRAREALREYLMLWLVHSKGHSIVAARNGAQPAARTIVSLIYAYILQSSLLDNFDRDAYLDDVRVAESWLSDSR